MTHPCPTQPNPAQTSLPSPAQLGPTGQATPSPAQPSPAEPDRCQPSPEWSLSPGVSIGVGGIGRQAFKLKSMKIYRNPIENQWISLKINEKQ